MKEGETCEENKVDSQSGSEQREAVSLLFEDGFQHSTEQYTGREDDVKRFRFSSRYVAFLLIGSARVFRFPKPHLRHRQML